MRNVIERAFAQFDARTPWFGLGRSVIALGQLTILLFTPAASLFVPVLGRPDAPYCEGIKSISLLCVGHLLGGPTLWIWLMVAVLVIIATGFLPRWTVIPHAWIAFSIAQSISLPDGGESVAQVVTLLLVPMGITDERRWHWTWVDSPPAPIGQAVSLSASLFVRIQLAAIYLNSGIEKLGTPAWLDGSAEFYIARSKNFGSWGPIEPLLTWLTSFAPGTAAISWGTIILECLLGLTILGPVRFRFAAVVMGVLLHIGIILTIGLWSFGLIMIGTLLIAASIDRSTSRRGLKAFRDRRTGFTRSVRAGRSKVRRA